MLDEKEFYQLLSKVPEPPREMFEIIEKKINKRNFIRKMVYSFTASFVIILTGMIFLYYNEKKIELEVNNELKNINGYINGRDIENDFELFAVVDDGY